MGTLKRILGWVLKAFGALAILLVLFVASIYFFSRQERALAREFLSLVGEKKYSAAFELTSTEMKSIYPLQALKSQFETVQAYTSVSFTSVNITTDKTTLVGRATTADNCVSQVVFVVADGKIATFQIDDACLVEQVST
ncbi:hypothetical protein [Ruegeria arenilitoris]|uniref:hypothetical protein n=1 Tax=Ruegeria arenilitoris TaxID=1173585 RepID=UPI0014813104|nr:hypothetical protein [Ruegeria arenilitoris]